MLTSMKLVVLQQMRGDRAGGEVLHAGALADEVALYQA